MCGNICFVAVVWNRTCSLSKMYLSLILTSLLSSFSSQKRVIAGLFLPVFLLLLSSFKVSFQVRCLGSEFWDWSLFFFCSRQKLHPFLAPPPRNLLSIKFFLDPSAKCVCSLFQKSMPFLRFLFCF